MPRTSRLGLARGLVLLLLGAVAGTAFVPSPADAVTPRCRAAYSCGVPQTITFPAVADASLRQGSVALHAYATVDIVTRTAGQYSPPQPSPIHYTSGTPAVCAISGATAVLKAGGTCRVTAHADADADDFVQAATPVTRSFRVTTDLRLLVPAGKPLSAHRATVRTESDKTGRIRITSRSPRVCRVASGRTVALVGPGTCSLRATQAGSTASASFAVWPTPALPAKARATEVLRVLGKGERDYRVSAAPAGVCRVADGALALIDGGTCRVTVRHDGKVVRTDSVQVTVPAKPAATPKAMDLGATVYFEFDSAALTGKGKATLRKAAKKLRSADLVVVYGHTYGPGGNGQHSQDLAAHRADAVVAYLDDLGVKSKAVSEVAMAMKQPVSKTPWKNRRAEVYFR